MNRTPAEWAKVDADAVVGGSAAQARNVLKMALQDISSLAAERGAEPQAAPVTRGPDCACCERQPRKDCIVPGCAMKDSEWAK